MLLHSASDGALTQLYAGTTPEGEQLSGKVSSEVELPMLAQCLF
jgi:hypothetical protein